MVDLLDRIGTFLEHRALAGTGTAWWLAKGYLPPQPDRVVALFEYAGAPPQAAGSIDRPGLQVRVRGRRMGDSGGEYAEARGKIEAIFLALHAKAEQEIETPDIIGLVAVQSPFSMGLDANQRHEFTVNFRCWLARH